MREIWRYLGAHIFVICFSIFPLTLFAKFEQTTGTKTDSSKFGGMSTEEVDQLLLQQLQNAYLQSVYDRIKKFDAGENSSKFDGTGGGGRYSGYGEAHITLGDSMIAHEGGANLLERAVEVGALGRAGLKGQAREKAIEEEMKKMCKPNADGSGCVNAATGQLQKESKDISPALYDAGPAHGTGKDAANDKHRVYAVKGAVRTEVEKVGRKYGDVTIADATLAPGKQPNLDLLHKSFSKMEQDKYIMMATDAFAFRSARLDGTDTSDSTKKNVIGEYKQIAIDAYAANPGNIAAAEQTIQTELAKRIATKKVLNNADLCADGKIKGDKGCGTAGQEPVANADQAAAMILAKFSDSGDGVRKAAIKKAIMTNFDPKTGNAIKTNLTLADVITGVKLRDLSGVADRQKLDQLYAEAQQNIPAEERSKIGEYQSRLTANKCISFRSFCYSSGVGSVPEAERDKAVKAATDGSSITKGGDTREFQPISGDPGGYFNDTREVLYNNFAYAYNQPLANWKGIVTMADFSNSTDKNIKDEKGKLYKEFNQMYNTAVAEADKIKQNVDQNFVNALISGGATQEQIARVQKNYGADGKFAFDAKQLSHMKLFGQNKDRDAVMMDFRKGIDKYIDPNFRNPPAGGPAPQNTFKGNPPPAPTTQAPI